MGSEKAAYRGGCRACQNLPKERYALKKTTTSSPFRQLDSIDDPLTEIARDGARRMLAEALKAEADLRRPVCRCRLPDGRQRVVRHGHGPTRTIQTGVGPLEVQRAKVRDRADVPDGKRSASRPRSCRDGRAARRASMRSCPSSTCAASRRGTSRRHWRRFWARTRRTCRRPSSPADGSWKDEYEAWRRRDLSARRYVYIWADGVYLQARMEPAAECILVVIGATPEGQEGAGRFPCRGAGERAELAGAAPRPEGPWARGSARARGRRRGAGLLEGDRGDLSGHAPAAVLAAQDGERAEPPAESHASRTVKPTCTRSAGPKAGRREPPSTPSWRTTGRSTPRRSTCLEKDRDALLAFYDFPAEHWEHLRTTNPIESVFATVRHRTVRTKGALSQKTATLMVFTLVRAAVEDVAPPQRYKPVCPASSRASNSPTVSPSAMPPKTAPPDQPASPKFSHSSAGRQSIPSSR